MAGKPGRSGRKAKPIELHVATGQYRPDRHGVPLAVVPNVPPTGWELDRVAALDRIWMRGRGGWLVLMVWLSRSCIGRWKRIKMPKRSGRLGIGLPPSRTWQGCWRRSGLSLPLVPAWG